MIVWNRYFDPILLTASIGLVFVLSVAFTIAAMVNDPTKTNQSKMEVKTVHRIVYFECGKHKFRLGENGVKAIATSKEPPVVGVIEYEGGKRTVVIPAETVVVTEEEQQIVVPKIVMADGTAKAE